MTNFIKTKRTNKNKPCTKSNQFKQDHDTLQRERKNARKVKQFLKSL